MSANEFSAEEFAEARRILRDAAELIDQRGWARFFFETSEGEHCLLGAVRHATDGSIYETRKSALATRLLAEELRARGFQGDPEQDYEWMADAQYRREAEDFDLATDWNDADDRTREEVVRLLREVGQG
ncbi:hypothetical protein GS534_24350 [Rhodococcus hoagii]|nr:hypothetical protein [Prescottella equi]